GLDAAALSTRRRALDTLRRQVEDAARLGATCAWLRAPCAAEGLPLFADGCALLADHAAGRMVRLAVAAGPALPALAAWLGWLASVGHAKVGVMLASPSAQEIHQAGGLLLGLRMEQDLPAEAVGALREIGYRGALSIPFGSPAAVSRRG